MPLCPARHAAWYREPHVGADNEHHQCEPDAGQQLKGRVGGIDDAEPGSADDDPGHQLTDHHRQAQPRDSGQCRTGQSDDRQQSQGVESETRHLRRSRDSAPPGTLPPVAPASCHDTNRHGIGVFSSVR